MTMPPYGQDPYHHGSYGAGPYGGPPGGQHALPASVPPYVSPVSPVPVAYGPMMPAAMVPMVPVPYGYPGMAVVGYGVDPLTGLPLSDKSKITAGLLQLLLGFMFGLGGVGRLYAGHTALGTVQLLLTVVGWLSFWCGFFGGWMILFIPFLVYGGIWLWFVVDGVVLLAGRPVDGQGRPLRG